MFSITNLCPFSFDQTSGIFRCVCKIVKSFSMFISLSAQNSAPTGRIFMKFDIWGFFRKCQKNSSVIKTDKNKGYFTWRPIYIFDHISLISS